MVSDIASTALMSVPGYAAATAATGNPTHILKSTAEATIQQHTPVQDFVWEKPMCFGCGDLECHWKKGSEIVCPHRDRPGARECALCNFGKMKEDKAKERKNRKLA